MTFRIIKIVLFQEFLNICLFFPQSLRKSPLSLCRQFDLPQPTKPSAKLHLVVLPNPRGAPDHHHLHLSGLADRFLDEPNCLLRGQHHCECGSDHQSTHVQRFWTTLQEQQCAFAEEEAQQLHVANRKKGTGKGKFQACHINLY